MASTNQTPHLGLSQWVLTDPFRMDDFNQDNAKIDAAVDRLQGLIDAMPYVKLMEVTTGYDAAQVDMDLSGIDFTKYAAVQIYSDAVARYNGCLIDAGTAVVSKINGKGGYLIMDCGSTTNQAYASRVNQGSWSTCPMQLTISGFQRSAAANGDTGVQHKVLTVACVGASESRPTSSVCACYIGDVSARLTKFSLAAVGSSTGLSYVIKAGAKIYIYGVKA